MLTKAHELAKNQRAISVSEFFAKNRHLLGFDNPTRALLMTVKETVDNALDATEEMGVLPEIKVQVNQLSETRFCLTVEDNGPGIVKQQIPNIFAKLLYGSKFHRLRMSRGQQGLGVSMSVLYSQLTTGKAAKITSKIGPQKPAHYYELMIDTSKNEPKILKEETIEWNKNNGTKIELEIEGKYLKGKQSIDEYIRQTAIVNPHAEILYINPDKEERKYTRVTDKLPKEPKEIKPHPHGIELGTFIKMLHDTTTNTIKGFLQNDFSRVGPKTASDICKEAKVQEKSNPKKLENKEAEQLFNVIQKTSLMSPPTDCLSPIGFELLEQGLKKEFNADYYVTITRKPAVYRGNPFQIEIAIAYGGNIESDKTVRLLRFANRVPLLYQQGACSITEAVSETNWRPYGLQQSGDNLPVGPAIVLVHMASVWVPFTSEAKDAIAHYPEIIKEVKLALQECGRKLGLFIRRNVKAKEQREKINLFEKYIPELADALSNLSGSKRDSIEKDLHKVLKKNINTFLEQVEQIENGKENTKTEK